MKVFKIDVEGYETEVIKGFGNTLGLMKECSFVVEVTPEFLNRANSDVNELYDCFKKFGLAPKIGISTDYQWEEVWTFNN